MARDHGMHKVTSHHVGTQEFEIYVDSSGRFYAVAKGRDPGNYEDVLARAMTLEEVKTGLKVQAKKLKLEARIPFVRLQRGHLRGGVARAVHAVDKGLLVTWAGGEKENVGRYTHSMTFLRPLTAEESIEIAKAAAVAGEAEEQASRANRWVEALIKPFEIRGDLRELVKEEIAKLATAAVAKDAADAAAAAQAEGREVVA